MLYIYVFVCVGVCVCARCHLQFELLSHLSLSGKNPSLNPFMPSTMQSTANKGYCNLKRQPLVQTF